MTKPIALITGASSGIGLELARAFAAKGYDLILTARREDRLDELAAELGEICLAHVIAVDLADRQGPETLSDRVSQLGLEIDVLVNNAGVLLSGALAEMPVERTVSMLDLNVRATTHLIQKFLPGMITRRRGRILNVASVASFSAVPGLAAYGASKAYLLSLTESLAEELVGTGVTVTALCPGVTRTEMIDKINGMDLANPFVGDPRQVAKEGLRALESGEVISVPGVLNQALVSWLQVQPRWLTRFFSGIAGRSSFNLRQVV